MFKRSQPLAFRQKISRLFWPQGGWKRYGNYLLLRLHRLKGTPRSIAAGVACGVAISFTPFVGFHMILAAATAWLVRGNILASALGTIIGNPWTFPFIWLSVLYTGRHMLGMSDHPDTQVDFLKFFEKGTRALMSFDFSLFFQDIWPILWPMMVGCIPYYIFFWGLSYFLTKKALDRVAVKRSKITQERKTR